MKKGYPELQEQIDKLIVERDTFRDLLVWLGTATNRLIIHVARQAITNHSTDITLMRLLEDVSFIQGKIVKELGIEEGNELF